MRKFQLLTPIFFGVFLFFLWSCHTKEPKTNITLTPIKDVVFDVGYETWNNNHGIIFDDKTKQEVVYFADLQTYRVIKFFTLDGQLLDSFDLKPFITRSEGYTYGVIPLSKDSALFVDSRANILQGISPDTTWLSLNLRQATDTLSDGVFEYSFARQNNTFNINDPLIFKASFSHLKSESNLSNTLSEKDYWYYFYTERYKHPNILVIKEWNSTLPRFEYFNLPLYPFDTNQPSIQHATTSVHKLNEKHIYANYNTNEIGILNNSFLEKNTIRVESEYTDIGTKYQTIKSHLKSDSLNFYGQTGNRLSDIYFSEKTQTYFIVLPHQTTQPIDWQEPRDFSLIFLDTNFAKIEEMKMDASKYRLYRYLNTKNNVYLRKRIENEPYGQYTYTVFNMERN